MQGGEKWKNQHKADLRFIHTYRHTASEKGDRGRDRQINGWINGRRKERDSLADNGVATIQLGGSIYL